MHPKGLAATALVATTFITAPLAAEELRFTLWTGNDAHLAIFNKIAEGFSESHPDVTVSFETIPAADYTQKLTFQLAGGNPPDLGWMFEDVIPGFVEAGVVEDLRPALEAAEGYELEDFSEPAMALWSQEDAIHGVPFSTSPFMIYYNKDMFDAAGLETPPELAGKGEWDMGKFREVAAALAEANSDKWGFEFKDGQGYESRILHAIMPAIRVYGGYAWRDGDCGFDEPEAVEAITQLHDMVFKDKSIVPPGEQGDFFSGNSAMTVNQISRASLLTDADFEWGIAPLPTGPAGASPIIGQAGIVVFSQSKKQELAQEFVAYMTNPENSELMAEFFPPARHSVLQSDTFVAANELIPGEQMAYVGKAIEEGNVLPSHPRYAQIYAAMKPRMDALWRADADVQASLEAVCTAIEDQL